MLETRTVLRKENERKKWEMGNILCRLQVNKYNMSFKIKNNIYIYIYIILKFIPILVITGIKNLFNITKMPPH